MQVSDVVFGIILICLLAWVVIIAVNQSAHAVTINNLAVRQGALISDPIYCRKMPDYNLVSQNDLRFREYSIVPTFTQEKQLVLCVYEKKPVG